MWIVFLTFLSVGFFLLGGFITARAQILYFGSGLFIAKGGAYALLLMTLLMIFFIHRGLLTLLRCRECCGRHASFILNEHVVYHQVCGALVLFYSIVHTVGHLYGTFPKLAENANLNQHLQTKRFNYTPNYF